MKQSLVVLGLLVGAVFFSASCFGPGDSGVVPVFRSSDIPLLGTLEHRGVRYSLMDLMDPAFRALHKDPFVQEFSVEESFAQDDMETPVIWAGRRIESSPIDLMRRRTVTRTTWRP